MEDRKDDVGQFTFSLGFSIGVLTAVVLILYMPHPVMALVGVVLGAWTWAFVGSARYLARRLSVRKKSA